jgi:hypothetical protein
MRFDEETVLLLRLQRGSEEWRLRGHLRLAGLVTDEVTNGPTRGCGVAKTGQVEEVVVVAVHAKEAIPPALRDHLRDHPLVDREVEALKEAGGGEPRLRLRGLLDRVHDRALGHRRQKAFLVGITVNVPTVLLTETQLPFRRG